MKKLIMMAGILSLSGLTMGANILEGEVVKSVRVNMQGGNFDEGFYDDDVAGVSGELEIGLRNGNITNSIGFGLNYYDFDDTDADPTTLEVYYSPRYTFDNNWYVSGRVGYSIGDDSHTYSVSGVTNGGVKVKEEIDMTGFVLGLETGYTFDNNFSIHIGYKAVETEATIEGGGGKYTEDGYTHLGYLGAGYTF